MFRLLFFYKQQIVSRVPQGSVIRPLLFLPSTNDIATSTSYSNVASHHYFLMTFLRMPPQFIFPSVIKTIWNQCVIKK